MWSEHGSASAVALEAWPGWIRLVVSRGALEQMPWFRGGLSVTAMFGTGREAGRMCVVVGSGHVLRAMVRSDAPLERLPPVALRMPALPWMARDLLRSPEAVQHRITPRRMELVLPDWAAPPRPAGTPPLGTFLEPRYLDRDHFR